jgi:catechol 2,3-dioxygenase-like lactoylglutathione lyase family enzyme
MKSLRVAPAVLVLFLCSQPSTLGQLAQPNAGGVAMGHLHYRVKDVEANKRFWVALGGQSLKIGNTEVVKFPGVLVFLTAGESSGGTEGSVVNHVAFRVPKLAAVEAAGLRVTPVAGFPGVASTTTPEGERIELFEDSAQNLTFTQDAGFNDAVAQRHNRPISTPIAFHHIHVYVAESEIAKVKAWYVRLFGGIPGKRSNYDAVDLPGMNLNISTPRGDAGTAPTRGRMLDHIGLEIRGLEAFCAKLQSQGVKFDAPYSKAATFASATFTDPWGTTVELTEGLRAF